MSQPRRYIAPNIFDVGVITDVDTLRKRTRWIRDVLDRQISVQGPDVLGADSVITIFQFLDELGRTSLPVETIRHSRIHFALLEIAGRATRWPGKLVDKAEEVMRCWETQHGPLRRLRCPLYEQGGRLHGISSPEDVERDKLLVKWIKKMHLRVSPMVARRSGALGFVPGQ